jgi:uncharacterized protein (TIGR00369 family)
MSIYTQHLDRIVAGRSALPPAAENLCLGGISEWRSGYACKQWAVDPKFFTAVDLFGGYLAAIADQMFVLSSISLLEDCEMLRTTSLQIDFFRPVSSGTLIIEGNVVNRSKRLIHVEVTFRDDYGQLAAKARGTLFIVERTNHEPETEHQIRELWRRADEPSSSQL